MAYGTFLSSSFLKEYQNKQPKHKGVLFEVIRLRYARWIPSLKRRERWMETVERVVNHSLSLYPKDGPAKKSELVKEAEMLFDRCFNLEIFAAGRSYWIAGTEAAKRTPENLFNCGYTPIETITDFCDFFHLLLCGSGVGGGIQSKHVSKLPKFYPHSKTIVHNPYNELSKDKRTDITSYKKPEDNVIEISVGDSKEGWVEALEQYLIFNSFPQKLTIAFNYNNIRPKGERLITTGGRAPGHKGLKQMFQYIEKILRSSSGKLTSLNVGDILNCLGKNTVIGGTRRAAIILLGDSWDYEFINAKKDLYTSGKSRLFPWRNMSNNSIILDRVLSLQEMSSVFERIVSNGEPGFLNRVSASKRRVGKDLGTNPCSEISLSPHGFCNLTSLNLASLVENNEFNHQRAFENIRLITRVGARHTNLTVSLKEWDNTQKRDRLLGVSITGYMDTLEMLGWAEGSQDDIRLLQSLQAQANIEADEYSHEMRIPRPLLVTTTKPEGSLSLLPTVSSGAHRAYSPFYIRRVRLSNDDPVAQALKARGVRWEPAHDAPENRSVFEFPIKSAAKDTAVNEPALQQLDRYLRLMENYVDHNCSITIYFDTEELPALVKKVHENIDKIVGCAFLPKLRGIYPQLVYEEINKEEYTRRIADHPSLEGLSEDVDKFENEVFEIFAVEEVCEVGSGSCPIL